METEVVKVIFQKAAWLCLMCCLTSGISFIRLLFMCLYKKLLLYWLYCHKVFVLGFLLPFILKDTESKMFYYVMRDFLLVSTQYSPSVSNAL